MTQNKLNKTLTPLAAVVLSGAVLSYATSVEAVSINRTSGSWTGLNGGEHIVYGNDNGGAVTFGSSTVQDPMGENQMRWGLPENLDVSEHQLKSGLGFEGVGPMAIDFGEAFRLGTLSHYNNPVWSGTAASSADLSIELDLGELGIRSFSFSFNIDETPNTKSLEDCVYLSDAPCADRVFWESAFPSESFTVDAQDYTVELLGFRSIDGLEPVDDFISQEGDSSSASALAIVGRLTPVPTPPPTDVPEPAALLGLGLVGGYWAIRHRRG